MHSLENVCPVIRSGDRKVDKHVADGLLKCIDLLQATKAIRGLKRAKGEEYYQSESKIYMATAVDDVQIMHKAIHECGANTYMVKPLDLQKIKRLLVRHQILPPAPVQETL